ncbi:MAG: sigma-54-dependent Fis family transcriptional regulator [Acidobacteria bacterium]|nr:sigma-54-dependent Fis family transcriptional regulator [Acidobacteriota bacterium]
MSAKPVLLIVDDEAGILEVVGRFARRTGFDVLSCNGGREALATLAQTKADLALVDVRMPDIGGLDVLRAIGTLNPSCQVVLMTGYATVESAVEAVKLGARDYLAKPLNFRRLEQLLGDVREQVERRRSVLEIESELTKRLEFCGMIGRGPAMQEIFDLLGRLAPHARTALIMGETGTGKELVAHAFHRLGPRRDRRFVTVNCSAVVETLFESELFGHVRGAFTGATQNKAGLFELADGGTLFLDEIGELQAPVQAKLLRALELGEVNRIGSLQPRHVDVHVIAATNRNLPAEVAAGRFRSDLYYRLNIIHLTLPPLGARREDIPYLIAAFVKDCAGRLGKTLVGVSAAAERRLTSAAWPGNVRQLRNVIERACIMADGDLITERELTTSLDEVLTQARTLGSSSADTLTGALGDSMLLSALEREQIVRALGRTKGNKKEAARLLGLSRRALYRRLDRFALLDTVTRRRSDSLPA